MASGDASSLDCDLCMGGAYPSFIKISIFSIDLYAIEFKGFFLALWRHDIYGRVASDWSVYMQVSGGDNFANPKYASIPEENVRMSKLVVVSAGHGNTVTEIGINRDNRQLRGTEWRLLKLNARGH